LNKQYYTTNDNFGTLVPPQLGGQGLTLAPAILPDAITDYARTETLISSNQQKALAAAFDTSHTILAVRFTGRCTAQPPIYLTDSDSLSQSNTDNVPWLSNGSLLWLFNAFVKQQMKNNTTHN
jgi:hypothetical protein